MTEQADASGLLYRRNRYYDPKAGRFTQPDPIGIAGGLNSYGYAGGDPVNFSDPFGLWPEWIDNLEIPRSWGELKEQVSSVGRQIRKNWHRLLSPDDPTQPRRPELEDIDLAPPPAEVRPAKSPVPGGVGPDGKRRLPGKDGEPGPEVKWEFRIPGLCPGLCDGYMPSWVPVLPRIEPWMIPAPGRIPVVLE